MKYVPDTEKANVIELERRPLRSLKGVITVKSAELKNFSARLEGAMAGRAGAAKDAPITTTA